MTTVDWKKLSWWIGGLVLLATLAAPELAAGQHSVSATIQESFEFNGELYGPGAVSVREVLDYNPATTLNEIWVGKRCLGLMLADISRSPSSRGTGNRMIFERSVAGHLVLVGFAYRDQPAREFYGYETAATGGRWSPPAERTVERIAAVMH